MSPLAPHQERVVEEKRDLDTKSENLATFLAYGGARDVDRDELARLKIQFAVMAAYRQILAERIAHFPGAT